MNFNDYQRAVSAAYEGGKLTHLREVGHTQADVDACGDGLPRFLLTELSGGEDCESLATAYQRVSAALRQLEQVRDILVDLSTRSVLTQR